MPRPRTAAVRLGEIPIHEDTSDDDNDQTMASDVQDTEEESTSVAGSPQSQAENSSDEEEEVEEQVAEDMCRFLSSFEGLEDKYRLINRIGEGTFSTVYKAEDLQYNKYDNDWDIQGKENSPFRKHKQSEQARMNGRKNGPKYVAIKKIYVTSSPIRIFNELELLHDLRGSEAVCSLITAFRHHDQVIAVLPYFQHMDFRDYFRDMKVADMRPYFRALFTGLAAVHKRGILHRDIKPTNFLYNPTQNYGVLVDFGLAERQGTDYVACNCELPSNERRHRIENSAVVQGHFGHIPANSYPKTDRDTRPSKRANRAGTRGFRAPEVLFKCTAQKTPIDIWSAGVILLTLLGRRFPFFHSADDIDALLELTHIFGKKKMKDTALLHGSVMDTNIPSYSDQGHSLAKIVLWATDRSKRDDSGRRVQNLTPDEEEAVNFMERCLDLDPNKRITAEEALLHPFIAGSGLGDDTDEPVLLF